MSLERLMLHRRLWLEKPALPRVYAPWFEALIAQAEPAACVLEVGAGPGFLRTFAATQRPDLRWVASDIHPTSWNDVAADAARLPFRDGTFGAVLGLDLLHHLARPAHFFAEAARVLGANGRLALVEPWITPLSWPIYRFAHQEECRLDIDPWRPFPVDDKDSFEGDAAVPWRLVRDTDTGRWRSLGLEPPDVRPLNGFAYLLSRGFRPGSWLPLRFAREMLALDRLTSPLAPWAGLRAVLTWRKHERPATAGTARPA